MNKFFLIIVFAVILSFPYQQKIFSSPAESEILDITTDTLRHELVVSASDEKEGWIRKIVELRNKLGEELVIKEVFSDCECAEAIITPGNIKINEVFDIDISIDMQDYPYEGAYTFFLITENQKHRVIRVVISLTFAEEKKGGY